MGIAVDKNDTTISWAVLRSRCVAGCSLAILAASLVVGRVDAAEYVATASSNLTFSPPSITILPGDTIRFRNGGGFHNVHADDDRFVCSVNCSDDTGPSSDIWSAVVHFDQIGTIGYYCEEHGGTGGGMRGSITVTDQDRVFANGFDPSSPIPLGVSRRDRWTLFASNEKGSRRRPPSELRGALFPAGSR